MALERGTLRVVYGPMFSGKTERLIHLLREAAATGSSTFAARPLADTRDPRPLLVSHLGATHPAALVAAPEELLEAEAATVAVDEAQFLPPSLLDVAEALRRRGTHVLVAGLDLDFRRRPFGSTLALAALADHVERLTAVCHRCGGPAALTQRLLAGRPAPLDDPTVRVGSRGLYEARCVACFEAEEALRPPPAEGARSSRPSAIRLRA